MFTCTYYFCVSFLLHWYRNIRYFQRSEEPCNCSNIFSPNSQLPQLIKTKKGYKETELISHDNIHDFLDMSLCLKVIHISADKSSGSVPILLLISFVSACILFSVSKSGLQAYLFAHVIFSIQHYSYGSHPPALWLKSHAGIVRTIGCTAHSIADLA